MGTDSLKPKVVVICGPTGVGKTSAAIEIAASFNGKIISADSMQVYRYMDIGTAKPTRAEQEKAPHHMIDLVNPDAPFDAAHFAKMAQKLIHKFHEQGTLPVVAGGTGLYIKALVHGLFQAAPANPRIRTRLKEEAASHGTEFLHKRLRQCDFETAERIHPNDTYRIIRALEIFEATGKPLSKLHREHGFADTPFTVLKIGLDMDRKVLYDRIHKRVDAMIDAGLLEEVRNLLDTGYSADLKSMQAIGYRHMADFIQGRLGWDEALRILERDTRRYAKRQLTWLKADPEIIWIDAGELNTILRLVKNFFQT